MDRGFSVEMGRRIKVSCGITTTAVAPEWEEITTGRKFREKCFVAKLQRWSWSASAHIGIKYSFIQQPKAGEISFATI